MTQNKTATMNKNDDGSSSAPEKKVSFDPHTSSSSRPPSQTPRRRAGGPLPKSEDDDDRPPLLERKIKADTTILFNVLCLGGFVSFLLYSSMSMSKVLKPRSPSSGPAPRRKRSRNGRTYVPVPTPAVNLAINADCDALVWGKSSLTYAKDLYGMFTIRNLTEGEVLSDSFLDLPSLLPSAVTDDGPDKDQHRHFREAFSDAYEHDRATLSLWDLARSHPDAHNVRAVFDGDANAFSLVVTRNVTAGSELFSDRDAEITRERFAVVDDLTKDVMRRSRRHTFQAIREGRRSPNSPYAAVAAHAVSKYDPVAAKLLPRSHEMIKEVALHGISTTSVRPHPEYSVRHNGVCLDRVVVRPSGGGQPGAFARTNVAEGETATTTPLYVFPVEFVPPAWRDRRCLFYGDVALCHAAVGAAAIRRADREGEQGQQRCEDAENNDETKECAARADANARFVWSPWNYWNMGAHIVSLPDALEKYPKAMSMDVVATRNIAAGEEILVGLGPAGDDTERMVLPDDLVPEKWRQ